MLGTRSTQDLHADISVRLPGVRALASHGHEEVRKVLGRLERQARDVGDTTIRVEDLAQLALLIGIAGLGGDARDGLEDLRLGLGRLVRLQNDRETKCGLARSFSDLQDLLVVLLNWSPVLFDCVRHFETSLWYCIQVKS